MNIDNQLVGIVDKMGLPACSPDDILKSLAQFFRSANLQGDLEIFGSMVNGFGTKSSDVDMVFLTNDMNDRKLLKTLETSVRRSKQDRFRVISVIRNARVPIIVLEDRQSGVEIDISFNNMFSIINSKLLKLYTQIHPKIRQLGLLIKYWAKNNGIMGNSGFSSYSLMLMLIDFLQQKYQLPYLQDYGDEVILKRLRLIEKQLSFNPYFFNDERVIQEISKKCQEQLTNTPLMQILLDFFSFYGERKEFDQLSCKVSIKKAKVKNNIKCNPFSIDDPFNNNHDPGSRYQRAIRGMRHLFNDAEQYLKHQDLQKLFNN